MPKKFKKNFKPTTLIIDVDGVLTDGQSHYTADGKVMKVFGPNDSEALALIRGYLEVYIISADKRGLPITRKRIQDIGFSLEFVGSIDRLEWIKKNFDLKHTIYIGDGLYDPLVFNKVAYSIAPANAFFHTKEKADFVTPSRGADSAVAEACLHILEKFFEPFDPNNKPSINIKRITAPKRRALL